MKRMILPICLSCVILLIVAEVYIRYFANYNEPYFDTTTKIIKRQKNTSGSYKTAYTNTGYFRINNDGWNSPRDYIRQKEKNKCRIAIVGHSNVEGLRVHVNKIFSKILEDNILGKGKHVEVYTFGFGGMHLAQALHVSRYVMKEYQPDVLIIGTLSDDFFYDHTEHSYFLSLNIQTDGTIQEIAPENGNVQYDSFFSPLYFLKTVKYADLRFHLGEKINSLIKKEKKDTAVPKHNHYRLLNDSCHRNQCLLALQYITEKFEELQIQCQKQFLFLAFPLQVPSFNPRPILPGYIICHQNNIIEQIRKCGFQVIDLEKFFTEDYRIRHKEFDFPGDGHYNEHAHQLIGQILSDYLERQQLIK